VRKAYVEWFDAIDALASNRVANEYNEMHGGVVQNIHDEIEDDHEYAKLSASVFAKAAVVNILDPAVDPRVYQIVSSLKYRRWHEKLPAQIDGKSIEECARLLAADILGHTSRRLLGRKPFKR